MDIAQCRTQVAALAREAIQRLSGFEAGPGNHLDNQAVLALVRAQTALADAYACLVGQESLEQLGRPAPAEAPQDG